MMDVSLWERINTEVNIDDVCTVIDMIIEFEKIRDKGIVMLCKIG